MADDTSVDVDAEAPTGSAHRPDADEGLKSAMAALLGLGPQTPGGTSAAPLRIPPPRPPDLRLDDPLIGPPADPSPEPSVEDFWSPPSREPFSADGPLVDVPPPVLDPPAPLLDPPEPIVDGPAPRLDAPPELVDALPDTSVEGTSAAERDLWAPPDSSADDFWAAAEPVSAADAELENESTALEPPPGEGAPWAAALGAPPPPAAHAGSTDTALQEAGLAGPLNTAMGDLRRLYPPDDHADALPPVVASPPAYPSRSPSRRHRSGPRAWWASRGRELVPGLAVAFVVALAFAVVLIGRGGDDERSRTDTKGPTTLPSTGTPTTAPTPSDLFAVVPPPEELPPADPGADASDAGSAPSRVSPPSTAQSRPRASGTRATPSPAPAPRPAPTAAPTTRPPSPATTQAPPTTASPTTRAPDPPDPCDRLFSPEARQKCLDGLGADD